MKAYWLMVPVAATLATGCGDSAGQAGAWPSGSADTLTFAVIPREVAHDYGKSIHAGAVQAAQELTARGTPVSVIWREPAREGGREQQVRVVESFLAQGVDGIVLAPLDEQALLPSVEEAKRAGVPTVIIDSDLQSEASISLVTTDHYAGGQMAADRLGALMGGKGKLLMLRYLEGSAGTRQREEGFLARIHMSYPAIEVVSSDQYAGPTRESAERAAARLLDRFGDQVQGIYTPNEISTSGMLLALSRAGRTGKIRLVGFDAGGALVRGVDSRQLHGLVVQNPARMGYLGVKTMMAHLQGEPVERRIDAGVTLITPQGLDSAGVRAPPRSPRPRHARAGTEPSPSSPPEWSHR